MSNQIDERIVSMQFDNRNFEANARTSMSTLDKLKEKLNFKAAAKGVDNLDAAVKKVDLSSIGQSADKVGLRFSAMYTVADQTFRNIINSAERTATRLASAFTIDPVKTGLSEYETKINAIQVIQSNTRGKNTMEDITSALDELNTYADKTIYNFAQMTSNIGKFVAQGLDVYKATNAVQGMANLAAASGASAEDMSRATYQMSQALGGTIRKIDWNSLRNANMATVDLKNTLMDLARVNGIDIDSMISNKGTFEDTLEQGWLSGELFTEAMNIYSGVYDEMELKSKGFTDEQVKNFMDLAANAASAATEVKTFTQLFDVLKETAQSGWTQTWEEIVGDFDSAKKTLTQVQNYFSGIIDAMSDARNFIVRNALNFAEPWTNLKKKLDESGIGKIVDKVADYTDKLQYFQDIMHSVWMGNYKNSDTGRYGLLDAAGYDHRVVQELVNISDTHYKEQGWKYTLTIDDIRAAHEKYGVALDENGIAMKETVIGTKDLTTALEHLSDERLKEIGLSDDEIKILRELQRESKRTGRSIEDIGNEMSTTTGRMLLIDSLKNVWSGLLGIFTAIGDAWKEIFPPLGFVQIYNAIKAVNKFSENLRLTEKDTGELTERGKQFYRIFKGIFAIIDIVTTILGGGFKIAFKMAKAILGLFNLDVLEAVALVGDAAVKFRDWIDSILDFNKIFKGTIEIAKKSAKAIAKWYEGLKEADDIPKYLYDTIIKGLMNVASSAGEYAMNIGKTIVSKLEKVLGIDISGIFEKMYSGIVKVLGKLKGLFNLDLSGAKNGISNWFSGLKETDNIPKYIISGLINGLKNGAKMAWDAIIDLGTGLIDKIKDVLGIHSPSTVFFAIGGFIIAGLIGGLLAGGSSVWDTITAIGEKCISIIQGMDIGAILASVLAGGTLIAIFKIVDVLDKIATPLEGVNDILVNSAKVVKKFAGVLGSVSNAVNAFALKQVAISIAILAGSIAILSFLNVEKVWSSYGVIAALAGIIGGLMVAMAALQKWGGDDANKSVKSLAGLMLSLSAIILVMGNVVKMLGGLDEDEIKQGLGAVSLFVLYMIGMVASTNLTSNNSAMLSLGDVLRSVAKALLFMTICVLILGKMDPDVLKQGGTAIAAFTLVMIGMVWMTKLAGTGDMEALSKVLISMGVTMLLMTACVLILGKMDRGALIQGGLALIAFTGIMVGMVAMTKLSGGKGALEGLGKTLMGMGVAFAAMALCVLILGTMDRGVLIQGGLALIAFTGIMVGMVAMTKLSGGKDALDGLSKTLIGMAVCMAIMAGVVALLGMMKIDNLIQGIAAVGFLTVFMALLVSSTKDAKPESFKTLIALTAAIAVMAVAIGVLSIVDWKKLATSTGAMILMMAALTTMFVVISKNANGSDKAMKALIAMTAVIAVIGVVMLLLGKLPWKNTLGAAGSLALTLAAMIGALAVLNYVKFDGAKVMKGVGLLAAICVPLYGLMTVLKGMKDVKNSVDSTVALSGFVLALTGVLAILNTMKFDLKNTATGVAGLALIMASLFILVGVLASMQGVKNAIPNAIALATLATVLSVLLIPLCVAGAIIKGTKGAALLGIAGLAAIMASLFIVVGVLALMNKIENAEANANLLTRLIVTLTAVLVVLAIVGPLALVGVGAMAALSALILAFGVFAVAIGALVDKFPQLETFLDSGMDIMIKMAEGLGKMIGKFITAFAGEVMTLLPRLGTCLSMFMVNATPFIAGAKMVDGKVLEGVGVLAASVILLAAADLIAGIVSFVQCGSSFADLGTELSQFMINAMPFILGASLLNATMMSGVKSLAETILILTAADVINGLTSWLTGGSSLADFGDQLAPFGASLAKFAENVSGLSEDSLTKAGLAADIVKTLAGAAKEIPNEGGWLAKIVGDNSIDMWGEKLPVLANGINGFITNLGTNFTDEQVSIADRAANIVKTLAKAATEIPNSGGWLAKIVGDNAVDTWGTKIPKLGEGLGKFVGHVKGITDATTANNAIDILKNLVTVSKDIPNSGGWLSKIVGDNDLGSFAEDFPKVGAGINGFVTKIGDVTTEKLTVATSAIGVITSLMNMATNLNDGKSFGQKMKEFLGGSSELEEFAKNLPLLGVAINGFLGDRGIGNVSEEKSALVESVASILSTIFSLMSRYASNGFDKTCASFSSMLVSLGQDIRYFIQNVSDLNTEQAKIAVANIDEIAQMLAGLQNYDYTGANSFMEQMKNFGSLAGSAFATGLSGPDAVVAINNGITSLVNSLSLALTAHEITAPLMFRNFTQLCVNAMVSSDMIAGFNQAGTSIVQGVIQGMYDQQDEAEAAATAIANAINAAYEAALLINSPSKVFYRSTLSVGEGIVKSLNDSEGDVSQAGADIAQSSIDSARKIMSKVVDYLNSDIDSQLTITPVLDLSEVRSGVSSMNGLLSGRRSLTIDTRNVGVVASSMSQRQNGTSNSDIVSSIKALSKDLANMPRESININGITYDDGSNIAEAVQTLVRAARIERRV